MSGIVGRGGALNTVIGNFTDVYNSGGDIDGVTDTFIVPNCSKILQIEFMGQVQHFGIDVNIISNNTYQLIDLIPQIGDNLQVLYIKLNL